MKSKEEILQDCIANFLTGEIDTLSAISDSQGLILEAMELYAGQSRWIEESRRIPKTNDKVLITDGNIIKTAFFETETGRWKVSGLKILPTHWQPLPTLPTPPTP